MNERRDNADLHCRCLYTADGEIYFLNGESKIPTLAITREAHNPVLQNIDDAFDQLVNNHDYRPSQADVQKALTALDTVLIALPNLCLSRNEVGWESLSRNEVGWEKYLEIGTTPAKYAELNEEERKFAERVYGQGDDFAKNMKMLKKVGISKTKLFVHDPDYVRKYVEEGAVARASWLDNFYDYSNFYNNSNFIANSPSISLHRRVRGVRREVAP